jgi:hypothetical protein
MLLCLCVIRFTDNTQESVVIRFTGCVGESVLRYPAKGVTGYTTAVEFVDYSKFRIPRTLSHFFHEKQSCVSSGLNNITISHSGLTRFHYDIKLRSITSLPKKIEILTVIHSSALLLQILSYFSQSRPRYRGTTGMGPESGPDYHTICHEN